MTNLVDYTARFLNTGDALDYTPDELDDLTDRKVEAVEFDGDALARIVRARRGAARATGTPDNYDTDAATRNVWGSEMTGTGRLGGRRMAAVGVAESGEVRAWTRRTAAGSLDGASLSGYFGGVN